MLLVVQHGGSGYSAGTYAYRTDRKGGELRSLKRILALWDGKTGVKNEDNGATSPWMMQ